MSELLYGIVLGVILALIAGIYMSARALRSQVDALRGEIALARIEGVLNRPPDSNGPTPTIRRRRRHLGVVSAVSGVTVGTVAWFRSHRGASVGLAATAALVAGGSLYLDGRDTRENGPAAPLPTASVSTSLLPTAASSRSNTATPTGARLAPSPSPRSAARDVVLRSPSPPVTAPGPTRTRPGPTPPPGPPVPSPAPEITVPPVQTGSSAPPAERPGDDPHCLSLELLGRIAAGTCVSL
ncbi:hypothetical protein AB0903_08950 [Streptomyces sp. NPDC048389]|uniref:hypothetical protein n=1 Tax=Streptomyces sp. NPDC048389 TaxID=3154622 RepID=UPI0034549F52